MTTKTFKKNLKEISEMKWVELIHYEISLLGFGIIYYKYLWGVSEFFALVSVLFTNLLIIVLIKAMEI